MFFDVFTVLCQKKGVSPNKALVDCEISRTLVAKWKKGAVPNGSTLAKLSKYFDVSTDYLMGTTLDAQIDVAESKLRHLRAALDFSEDHEREELEKQIEALEKSYKDLCAAKGSTKDDGMPHDKQAFSTNLNLYLDSYGANESDLCKLCGVSRETASGWCSGQIMPSMDQIEKLADYFGCRVADLVESRRVFPWDDSLRFPYRISEETLVRELVAKCNADINKVEAEVQQLNENDQKSLIRLSVRILSLLERGGNLVLVEDPALLPTDDPQDAPAPKDTSPAADASETPPEDG